MCKNNNESTSKLIEVSYSNSGDSNDNIYKITLNITKKTIITEYKAIHSDSLEVKKYKVSSNNIDKIVKLIEKNHLINYTNLPIDTDFIAYDAPSKSLGFVYINEKNNKECYSISYNSKFPQGALNKVKEVTKNLISLTNNEKNLISMTKH